MLCKKEGCFCPEEGECLKVIANTPLWLHLAFTDYVEEKVKKQ